MNAFNHIPLHQLAHLTTTVQQGDQINNIINQLATKRALDEEQHIPESNKANNTSHDEVMQALPSPSIEGDGHHH